MQHVLDYHSSNFPNLQGQIQEMRSYYGEKYIIKLLDNILICRLWSQLTETLLKYIEEPQINQGDNLINLYNGFVQEFEMKIDPIKFVQIIVKVSEQFLCKF